jgi:release factor glutamine methyltransferase
VSELTLRAVLAEATERLAAAGVPSPRADAEQLAAHVLATSRAALSAVSVLPAERARELADLVDRRAARIPLQHLVGSVGFRHLELVVGPGVFIPRPETEVVAGWAIDVLRGDAIAARLVVDLCTGSGAIAAAIATEVPAASVHAVEIDADAVDWARRNLAGTSVVLHRADARDALPELDGRVDLVVSNPPYVPTGEHDLVDREVRDHDPAIALWSGAGRARHAHRSGTPIRAAAATRRPARGRAQRPQGESAAAVVHAAECWVDIRDHHDLTGDPGSSLRGRRHDEQALRLHRHRGARALDQRSGRGDPQGRAGRAADRHGLRGSRPTLLAAGGHPAAGGEGPRPRHAGAVLIGSWRAARALTDDLSAEAEELIAAFWPGPLTLVVKQSNGLAWDLGDAHGTVAIRMPLHPVALDLLAESGPLAVSSANRTGSPAPTSADDAEAQLGVSVAVYLDAGATGGSLASTIVDVTGARPQVLREGAVSQAQIDEVLAGEPGESSESSEPAEPSARDNADATGGSDA